MPSKKKPSPSVPRETSANRNISIGGDVVDSVVIAGDGNKVNIIQKFFNIFKSDAETVDQRNRRIMLGHVENFWVKGILEKSLHGAALLDLGIKEDPDALSYPWAIKREANKETLPPNTSMLDIFQEIGMGRSLLILGAPGSGKTTMLLELTRQLIERARMDVTEPIPVVFNLSSWTEKLPLADWLAKELNVIYAIPKKIAPTWVKENKMLLLLDGLDEVRQESRDKCVDAINQFRKGNGLTSVAVCSRIQDYAELKTRLSFDGAIEIQPLTSKQVNEYFDRLGEGLAGIRQLLEKDTVLREMAETPLFLSIMTLAYRDTESKDILVSETLEIQRKWLFDTYIERMFERPERSKNERFKKQDVLHTLSWLAKNMTEYNQTTYMLENMQPVWLSKKEKRYYKLISKMIIGAMGGVFFGLSIGLRRGVIVGLISGLVWGLINGMTSASSEIKLLDVKWDWIQGRKWVIFGLITGLIGGLMIEIIFRWSNGVIFGLLFGLNCGVAGVIRIKTFSQTEYPGQRITLSIKNSFFALLLMLPTAIFFLSTLGAVQIGLIYALIMMLLGGVPIIQHYSLRLTLFKDNIIPWRLIPFLNHCCDLIFLRRVGGGYIFVHRLLMEHFAAMNVEKE